MLRATDIKRSSETSWMYLIAKLNMSRYESVFLIASMTFTFLNFVTNSLAKPNNTKTRLPTKIKPVQEDMMTKITDTSSIPYKERSTLLEYRFKPVAL